MVRRKFRRVVEQLSNIYQIFYIGFFQIRFHFKALELGQIEISGFLPLKFAKIVTESM